MAVIIVLFFFFPATFASIVVNVTTGTSESGWAEDAVAQCEDEVAKGTMVYPAEKCITLASDAEATVAGYGGEDVKIVLTPFPMPKASCNSSIGDVQACVTENTKTIFVSNFALMSEGGDSTLAHEYVHILTSDKERAWLASHADVWAGEVNVAGNATTPAEGVADCSVSYFTPSINPAYMPEGCSATQMEIATALIEDTLV